MIYGKSSAVTFSFLSPSSITRLVTFFKSSLLSVMPNLSKFFFMLAFPEVLPKAYSLTLPNRSGSKSLKLNY